MVEQIPERYVALVRAVERLVPGFIDADAAPPAAATPDEPEPARLREEIASLREALPLLHDPARERWLAAQLRAAETVLAIAAASARGERLPLAEEAEGLFGLAIARVPEARFAAARAALDDALPGTGPLAGRVAALEGRLALPPGRVVEVHRAAAETLASRARAIVELPDDEAVEWTGVGDRRWRAYCRHLGGHRSLNELNLDVPWHVHDVPQTAAHEAYPGHHTERVAKAVCLVEPGLRPECAVMLLLAPEAAVAEAIAVCALEVALDEQEVAALVVDLGRVAGVPVDPDDVGAVHALRRFADSWWDVSANAAFLRHVDGATADDVVDYLRTHALWGEEDARHALRAIDGRVARTYTFCYSEGRRLLRSALAAPPDAAGRRGVFRRALEEALLPGDLAAVG